ncbi:MAG: GTPase HflX [Deltaproteobacteria bacterium]|nr:GTPase HflX [Deltaproteobacteria bacterium]
MKNIHGNIAGLKASQKKALERTYHRKVASNRIVSAELATHLAWISRETGRQVGVLLNRRGQVEETFVGDARRIYLPDIGRQRAGLGHFRGLRHVHTVLDQSGISKDDLADLSKLRLDMVVTVDVTEAGEAGLIEYAAYEPGGAKRDPYRRARLRSVHELDLDFEELMRDLERELYRADRGREAAGRLRAMLLGVYANRSAAERSLAELKELAATAGVVVAETMIQVRAQVDHKFVVGRGKLEEAVLRCLDLGVELIIVDHNLSPAQARAIAAMSDLKVIDRTQLILDIFAQHAQSRDGKLQVELAQLKYNLPRLTDLDAGLSRLTGGIGGRGPGETKLEINRRRARDRITRLSREIETLSQRRALRRKGRAESAIPIISIVGYTNAGKSTLMNVLTGSEVLVANQLFATLDPTSRRLRFPEEREAIITDTVGFIRDLPPDLLKAFRATLEELEGADLLLHVVDISDPDREAKIQAVHGILDELQLGGIPRVMVFNKADLAPPFEAMALSRAADGVAISAQEKLGLDKLVRLIGLRLWQSEALHRDHPWSPNANRAARMDAGANVGVNAGADAEEPGG